ncbi:MAG: hypothetical protein KatS3mg076_1152 [Candidatus Binatia bacterium]|nr:MAG: hypothetical protein KatS3mg076_1152 [Candidatus Binatia bacterium]
MNARGHVFLEILLGLFLVATALGAGAGFFRDAVRQLALFRARSQAQDTLDLALHWMAAEIRQAGLSLATDTLPGIVAGDESYLELRSDRNLDGDFSDPNERVAYSFDAARKTLTRKSGSSSPQPVIDGLARDGLAFRFYDGDGVPLATPLDDAGREAVRKIAVRLALELDSGEPEPVRFEGSLEVGLRHVPDSHD